jgi:hypothetical protein
MDGQTVKAELPEKYLRSFVFQVESLFTLAEHSSIRVLRLSHHTDITRGEPAEVKRDISRTGSNEESIA